MDDDDDPSRNEGGGEAAPGFIAWQEHAVNEGAGRTADGGRIGISGAGVSSGPALTIRNCVPGFLRLFFGFALTRAIIPFGAEAYEVILAHGVA